MKGLKKCLAAMTTAVMVCLSFTAVHAQTTSKGLASFYSNKLHGRRMSNGQRYHKDSLTCAHRKYPLGTKLRVRNPLNNKEVIVTVTDRGPFTRRFIIDLSLAAVKRLGLLHSGFMNVEISVYKPGEIPFRPKDEEENIPELDLEYQNAATFPHPLWEKTDSTLEKNGEAHSSTSQPAARK